VNSRHTVTGRIGIAAAGASATAGFIFVALFLAGDPRLFDHEWLGLVSLIAGLGSGMLWGHSRGQVSRSKLVAGLSCLALWSAAALIAN
jgi:membrane-associated PAP2 superfamily phosphatase